MKGLQGNALNYRDWKYSKWFMIPIFLELLFFNVQHLVNQGELLPPGLVNSFSSNFYVTFYIVFTITISLMSVTLFYYERNSSVSSLSASMPFRKAEILRSKWVVGIYNITIPYLLAYVLLNAILICNFCWTNFFFDISKWLITGLLTAYFIFGFVSVAQSINGSAILGSVTTVLFTLCPFTVVYTIYEVLYRHYGLLSSDSNLGENPILIPGFLKGITDSHVIEKAVKFILDMFNISWDQITAVSSFHQSNPGFAARIAFFVSFIILFYFLSLKIFAKGKSERTGYLTSSGILERLMRIVISYSAGFLSLMVYSSLVSAEKAFRLDFALISCVVLPVPLYFIIGKAIRVYNKQIAQNQL